MAEEYIASVDVKKPAGLEGEFADSIPRKRWWDSPAHPFYRCGTAYIGIGLMAPTLLLSILFPPAPAYFIPLGLEGVACLWASKAHNIDSLAGKEEQTNAQLTKRLVTDSAIAIPLGLLLAYGFCQERNLAAQESKN